MAASVVEGTHGCHPASCPTCARWCFCPARGPRCESCSWRCRCCACACCPEGGGTPRFPPQARTETCEEICGETCRNLRKLVETWREPAGFFPFMQNPGSLRESCGNLPSVLPRQNLGCPKLARLICRGARMLPFRRAHPEFPIITHRQRLVDPRARRAASGTPGIIAAGMWRAYRPRDAQHASH